jgi:hypothetical protein
MPDIQLDQLNATCDRCGGVVPYWGDSCSRCGKVVHPPHRLRIMGGIYLLVGAGLSGVMVYIIYVLAYIMRHSRDPGAKVHFNGNALQAVMVFAILSVPLLVGVTLVLTGLWQLRYGRRNLKLVKVTFVWFYLLIGASLLIQGANLVKFLLPR